MSEQALVEGRYFRAQPGKKPGTIHLVDPPFKTQAEAEAMLYLLIKPRGVYFAKIGERLKHCAGDKVA